MNTKISALAAIVLIVAGCQTAPIGPIPSNNFTFNASKQATKEAIVSAYLGRGFQIVRDSDLQLVMDRPAKDNFGAQLVFGSQWNVVPNSRLSMTFLGDNPTQVNAQLAIVTNPGSGFEQVTDLTNNASARQQLQIGMSQAKSLAEGQRPTLAQPVKRPKTAKSS